MTQQRISQLLADKTMLRDESDKTGRVLLAESLRSYYLSNKATGDTVNYWKERALRERANRKLDELELKRAEGSVYDSSTVELAFIEMLSMLRTHLLGLPSKFAVQLEGKNRNEIYDILTQEIEMKLTEMSEYNFKDSKT